MIPYTAGALWFAMMFALGFLLGPIRIFVLEPAFGATPAVLAESLPMLAVMILLVPWVARICAVPAKIGARLRMGGTGLVLLLLAETAMAALLRGQGIGFWLVRAQTPDGWVYFTLLAAFALIPLLRRHA